MPVRRTPILPILLAALLFFVGGVAQAYSGEEVSSSPLASIASLPDDEWLSAAVGIQRKWDARPPVEIVSYHSNERQIDFRFRVDDFEDDCPSVALVVPEATITTATLSGVEVVSPDSSGYDYRASITSETLALDVQLLGYVRNHRIARVAIPQTLPTHAGLRVRSGAGRIVFDVHAESGPVAPVSRGAIRQTVERFVSNPQDLDRFAVDVDRISSASAPLAWVPGEGMKSPFWLRLPVARTGLYRITGAELLQSGVVPASVSPSSIHLVREGQRQPMLVIPGSSTTGLAADAAFVFYGYENDSRFTTTATYWLASDPSSSTAAFAAAEKATGQPTQTAIVYQDFKVVEQDHEVFTRKDEFLSILGYRWIWQELDTSHPLEFEFDLPGLAPSSADLSSTLHLYCQAWSPGQMPAIRVTVNGGLQQVLRIGSEKDLDKPFRIPVGLVRERGNKVRLELVQTVTTASSSAASPARFQIYMDRLSVSYSRLYKMDQDRLEFASPSGATATTETATSRTVQYRIANVPAGRRVIALDTTGKPASLVELTVDGQGGASFVVPERSPRTYLLQTIDSALTVPLVKYEPGENLRSTGNVADYIIISHADFLAESRRFAEWKQRGGQYVVKVVDVRDVYDQFAAGMETPEAIRAFLGYAAKHWKGTAVCAPATYVLLVGDATSAYRNEFRNQVANFVPSCTLEPQLGSSDRYASDKWFVTFCGEDWLADAFLGRFSANNVADLRTIIDKQIAYTTSSAAGAWRNTLAYVADHSDFEASIRNVQARVPREFFQQRVFMSDEPWIDNYYFPKEIADAKKAKVSPETTRKIRDTINSGTVLLTYFGHGSPNIWSNERIWFGGDSENSDNLMLTNRDRLPILVNMTCNSGAIDYPMPKWNVCITEDFMRVPNGGAVACYVPTGPGVTSQHELFTQEITRSLLRERVGPLAPAFALAEWRYILAQNPVDLVRMFVLLGDPSLIPCLTPLADLPPGDRTVGQAPLPEVFRTRMGNYQFVSREDGSSRSAVMDYGVGVAALAPPEAIGGAYSHAAVAAHSGGGRQAESVVAPLLQEPVLDVLNWRTLPTAVLAGVETTFQVVARNTCLWPARQLSLELSGPDGVSLGVSQPMDLLAGETAVFAIKFRPPVGLKQYRLTERRGARAGALTGKPLNLAAADPNSRLAAVDVDTSSVRVEYLRTGEKCTAIVRFDLWNISAQSLATLKVALRPADGYFRSDTLAFVPHAEPGAMAKVELRLPLETSAPQSMKYVVQFDPESSFREGKWPEVGLLIGHAHMADLMVVSEGIRASNTSPTSGESVFFDVPVANRGDAAATRVHVRAFDGVTSGAFRLESRVREEVPEITLEPGETRSFRVRWDPFRNEGSHTLRFEAVSGGGAQDRNSSDNSAIFPLKVRTKYHLRPAGIRAEPLTQEDIRLRQVRITARVSNLGESLAHGVKVIFYPSHARKPSEILGEATIDEIPPKSVREATITYKLKPGEGSREFNFAFEALLKGSSQRVPYPD